MISCVVLTKNEEDKIAECIKSINFCDEIVIVDDNSTDKTVEKCKITNAKCKIYKRNLDGDFSKQRNFGLEKVHGDWILFVDADERVTPELADEIKTAVSAPKSDVNGYEIRRQDTILGKKLKHGEFGSIRLLRLARKGCGKWVRRVHEYWNIEGEIGTLSHPLIHISHGNLKEIIASINNWSTMHALANYEEGKRSSLFKIILYPIGHFFRNYVLKFGFLDGMHGFVLAVLMSFHSFLSWGKIWMHQKGFTKV